MLSYRHGFHAGNFADVLKHVVLVEILHHLIAKEKPFDFIDTHAGAGLYHLGSEQATKTAESQSGIGLLSVEDVPELAAYFEVIDQYNPTGSVQNYPGSPAIALHYLRSQDSAWFFELQAYEARKLQNLVGNKRSFKVRQEDGLAALLGLVPPPSRRGLVFIDPSYEIKTEFRRVVEVMTAAHRKFATGIYALWYPVVDRGQACWLERHFQQAKIHNIQVFELGQSVDSLGRGMTSSCMLVINPPWKLRSSMTQLLPLLAQRLGRDGRGFSEVRELCPE